MALTRRQKENFAEVVFEDTLEQAIAWIRENMTPDEICGKQELAEWLQQNKQPDDIFEDNQLEEWAEANGYKMEE
jgi:hypothetical protein